MAIILNREKNGHNVHDKHCHIGNSDVDKSCRSPVYVHYFDSSPPAWYRYRGIRRLGASGDPRQVQGRTSSIVRGLVLAITLFCGAFFANSASAVVTIEALDSSSESSYPAGQFGITSQPIQQSPAKFGETLGTGISGYTSSVRMYFSSYNYGGGGTMGALRFECYDNNQYTPVNESCSSSFFPLPSLNGTSKTLYVLSTQNFAFQQNKYYRLGLACQQNCRQSSASTNASLSVFGSVNDIWSYGTFASSSTPTSTVGILGLKEAFFQIEMYTSSTPESFLGDRNPVTLVPTSTYSGTFQSSISAIGWGSATGSVSSTGTYTPHLNEMVGVATTTFPMCLVYPWFELLDLLEGQTLVQQTPQSIVVSGGLIPTSTIALTGVDDVFAGTGLKPIWDYFVVFFEAGLWLWLGFKIWEDLFLDVRNPE